LLATGGHDRVLCTSVFVVGLHASCSTLSLFTSELLQCRSLEMEEEDTDGVREEEEEEGDEVTEMGQSGAAEAAVRQAEAEGLTLQPSDNIAGYRGVRKDSRHDLSKPFYASVRRDSKKVHLGSFATAEEAALTYARTPEAQAQMAKPKAPKAAPLKAEEAVAQAAAEGLTLEPGSGATGYKGVNVIGSRYRAKVKPADKWVHLGCFATAEQAALVVARADARTDPPAASPAAAKRAAPPPSNSKPTPAKQPRHTPPPRPVQPVPLPKARNRGSGRACCSRHLQAQAGPPQARA